MKMLFAIPAIALAGAAAAAMPAQPDGFRVTVAYGDLNLENSAGRTALEARISAGAREACGKRSIYELSLYVEVQNCQQSFIASARRLIENARRAA
jgi:UrcA family protein